MTWTTRATAPTITMTATVISGVSPTRKSHQKRPKPLSNRTGRDAVSLMGRLLRDVVRHPQDSNERCRDDCVELHEDEQRRIATGPSHVQAFARPERPVTHEHYSNHHLHGVLGHARQLLCDDHPDDSYKQDRDRGDDDRQTESVG